jgi:hypothetical protein
VSEHWAGHLGGPAAWQEGKRTRIGAVWLAAAVYGEDESGRGRKGMGSSTRIIRAVLLAAAAVVLAIAAAQLRDKRQTAELTAQNIHDQLDALDPVTRAAVVARLSSDEVKKVRSDRK